MNKEIKAKMIKLASDYLLIKNCSMSREARAIQRWAWEKLLPYNFARKNTLEGADGGELKLVIKDYRDDSKDKK